MKQPTEQELLAWHLYDRFRSKPTVLSLDVTALQFHIAEFNRMTPTMRGVRQDALWTTYSQFRAKYVRDAEDASVKASTVPLLQPGRGQKCFVEDCRELASTPVYSLAHSKVLLACESHVGMVLDSAKPEHRTICPNCGCRNPVG